MTARTDVTALLLAWSEGDAGARNDLIDAVYRELRAVARGYLRRERPDHSLPPTALVHEAYMKLVDQRRVRWQNRAHFFAIAAQVMRRILVDHARSRAAAKRGGSTVSLHDDDAHTPPLDIDILALDSALVKLAAVDPRQSRLVELRFFAGLTVEETAAAIEVAPMFRARDNRLHRDVALKLLPRQFARGSPVSNVSPGYWHHSTIHSSRRFTASNGTTTCTCSSSSSSMVPRSPIASAPEGCRRPKRSTLRGSSPTRSRQHTTVASFTAI